MEYLFTQSQIIDILQLSRHAFLSWGVEPVKKEKNRYYYDLKEVLQKKFEEENKNDSNERLRVERIRLTQQQTKKAETEVKKNELEISILESQLFPEEIIKAVWEKQLLNFKTKLLAMPSRLALRLQNKKANEIEKIIKKNIEEALNELRQFDKKEFEKMIKEKIKTKSIITSLKKKKQTK